MQPLHKTIKSFYLLPEWASLMERWDNLQSKHIEVTGEHGGKLQAVVYLKNGQVIKPSYAPYLSIEFTPTSTDHAHKITGQWLDTATLFINELRHLGWKRWLTLPPEITDLRPFSWDNILVSPRYTYYIQKELLGNRDVWSRRIKRSVKSAEQEGYTVARNADLDAVMHNIASTERRQGFEYSLTKSQLDDALLTLGAERLRLFNAYDKNNQPACSIIVLYKPGAVIQDWVAATAAEHLKSGVTQLVRASLFDDLKTLDAPAFDFCGANIPSVSAAKAEFGGTLMPFYQIEPLNTRYLVKCFIKMLQGKH